MTVHTVAALELLLDGLANYDAGCRIPSVVLDEMLALPQPTLEVTLGALEDAAVRLGVDEMTVLPRTALDVEEYVTVHEEAVELLTERIARGGRRRKAVAL